MGRPNRNIAIHRDYMDHQLQRVKDVIHLLTEKDRLNDGDIQAIRELLNIYVSFVNVQKQRNLSSEVREWRQRKLK